MNKLTDILIERFAAAELKPRAFQLNIDELGSITKTEKAAEFVRII